MAMARFLRCETGKGSCLSRFTDTCFYCLVTSTSLFRLCFFDWQNRYLSQSCQVPNGHVWSSGDHNSLFESRYFFRILWTENPDSRRSKGVFFMWNRSKSVKCATASVGEKTDSSCMAHWYEISAAWALLSYCLSEMDLRISHLSS